MARWSARTFSVTPAHLRSELEGFEEWLYADGQDLPLREYESRQAQIRAKLGVFERRAEACQAACALSQAMSEELGNARRLLLAPEATASAATRMSTDESDDSPQAAAPGGAAAGVEGWAAGEGAAPSAPGGAREILPTDSGTLRRVLSEAERTAAQLEHALGELRAHPTEAAAAAMADALDAVAQLRDRLHAARTEYQETTLTSTEAEEPSVAAEETRSGGPVEADGTLEADEVLDPDLNNASPA